LKQVILKWAIMMSESLIILAEECAEVQQEVSKILRFGPEEANLKNLEKEIGDVIAMMVVLAYQGIINEDKVMRRVPTKLRKLKKWSDIKDLDAIIENL
jgi:NTP pyrophosphatase (non-canonical NTP hydrolase)